MSEWNRMPSEWHGGWLPPGTPAPYSEPMEVTCRACETDVQVTLHHELGAVDIVPEECPACGEPWSEDILDTGRAPEPDPDQLREQEWEARQQDEEDRRDERNENYPEDIPH
jgi:hypothetical protein